TTAPSAMAAAHGMLGTSAWATTATAAVVSATTNTTRLATGSQLSLRSRSEASKAASSRIGATNSASASSGGTVKAGAPGTNASRAPPTARNTGYGAPTRRAAADSSTAAMNKPTICASSLMPSRRGGLHRSAVDELLPVRRVPGTLHSDVRDCTVDIVKIVGRQLHGCGPDVLLQAVQLRRAGNRNDPRFLGQQPRQRNLGSRRVLA